MFYKRISKIQSGSFSVVYKGVNEQTGELVALKCISKPVVPATANGSGKAAGENDPRLIQRQQNKLKKIVKLVSNEYEILLKLQKHPYICSMLDFFETAEYFVFVLEYCENGDLYDYIKMVRNRTNSPGSSVPLEKKLDFFKLVQQVSSALQYSHSLNIAHRDIKPENILLDANLNVKLTDWGLSYIGEYNANACIGTEKYLSPETFYPGFVLRDETIEMNSIIPNYITHLLKDPQLLTERGYNCMKADYWSLGITLLYTLFASCPFKYACLTNPQLIGKKASQQQLQQQQQQQQQAPQVQQQQAPQVQQANRNFQVFITNPMKFIDEYYFQSLVRQETMNSMYYSKRTIHAAMNIQDEKNYPAFWLTLSPPEMDRPLEVDKPYRLWLLHELSKGIVDALLPLNFNKRSLRRFDENLAMLWYSQATVVNNRLPQHLQGAEKEPRAENAPQRTDTPVAQEIMNLYHSTAMMALTNNDNLPQGELLSPHGQAGIVQDFSQLTLHQDQVPHHIDDIPLQIQNLYQLHHTSHFPYPAGTYVPGSEYGFPMGGGPGHPHLPPPPPQAGGQLPQTAQSSQSSKNTSSVLADSAAYSTPTLTPTH